MFQWAFDILSGIIQHKIYHEEVGITGCGVEGCDYITAIAIWSEQWKEEEE